MEAHLTMWLGLLLRWAHFIVGIAWIGASFYFNWLENHLQRQNQQEDTAGDLWAIHGGGFYYLKKFKLAPDELPPTLHWFKWEAYTTWLSGMALLIVVFYFNAGTYMLNPEASGMTANSAVAIGVGSLLLSWFVYDGLCRSPLARHETWLGVMVLLWFTALAWGLDHWLSGRAMFIHVGAAIGTVMVANVFMVIIPAQKDLVNAVIEKRRPNANKGLKALQRSRHNNYLTLPVLFMMISGHFPATYSHSHVWLVLLIFSMAAVALRHFFNIRHLPGFSAWPLIPAVLLLAVAIWMTAPQMPTANDQDLLSDAETTDLPPPSTQDIATLLQQRCTLCHAPSPEFAGFVVAPLGIELDTEAKLLQHAERVYQTSSVIRSMPLGNMTKMTTAERQQVASWYKNLDTSTQP